MFVATFILLAVLQVSFGQLPTSMPTGEPTTATPTVQLTQIPNTTAPTMAPTGEPTTATPTVQLTQIPTTAAPTMAPTPVPGYPTMAPTTAAPTFSPTSFPTVAIGSPMIVFGLAIGMQGVSGDDMNNNVAAQQAAEEATCNSMGNGVTANMCKFVNAIDTSSSRRLSGRKLVVSCDVNVQANIPLTSVTGGNDDAQESYDLLTSTINTAASTGALTQAIQAAAAEDGASILSSATSDGSVSEDVYVSYDSTYSPTRSPTLSPSNPLGDSDDSLSGGEIAGIVIGAIFGVFILYALVQWIFSDEDVSSTKKMSAPPFRKPAEHEAANIL